MKEKILELRKKGYSYNQIVEELECAKSTVSYHLRNVEESKFRPKNEEDVKANKRERLIEFVKKNY